MQQYMRNYKIKQMEKFLVDLLPHKSIFGAAAEAYEEGFNECAKKYEELLIKAKQFHILVLAACNDSSLTKEFGNYLKELENESSRDDGN